MSTSTEVRSTVNTIQLVRALRTQRERFAPDIRWSDGGEDWRTFCTIANAVIEPFAPKVGTAIRSHVFDYEWTGFGRPLNIDEVGGAIAEVFRAYGTIQR